MKTIRLFGVDIQVKQDDPQDTITTNNDEASRKRKLSPYQEEDDYDDHSFIPKKPKLLRLSDDGEEAVPPSEFHPPPVTTDDAICGRRKLATPSPNQEEDDDPEGGGEEAVPPRKLAVGSSIQEEDYDLLPLSIKHQTLRFFGVYTSINQEDHAAIQNPNQEGLHPPEGNLVLMFKKKLTSSDVSRNHNRLLITKRSSLMAALTEEERGRVEVDGGDNLRVVTTDPDGDEYILKLKRWAGSGALVLIHEWGKLVRANGLESGDSVQGWGYRIAIDGEFRLFLFTIKNLSKS
ncbi:hypothetical protein AAHA92_24458 [Salvia divinorum]|uniref:TF-B3 domain-containing protein n=1 Tax=Salvia divinorum TaxID=28513 RepID=A0ABD1G7F5_SALDI